MLSTLARIFSASLYYWASSFLALALYAAWTRKQLKISLRVARIMLDHTRKGRPHRQQFHNSGHAWLACKARGKIRKQAVSVAHRAERSARGRERTDLQRRPAEPEPEDTSGSGIS